MMMHSDLLTHNPWTVRIMMGGLTQIVNITEALIAMQEAPAAQRIRHGPCRCQTLIQVLAKHGPAILATNLFGIEKYRKVIITCIDP